MNTRCGLVGEHLSHSYSPRIHALLEDYPYALIEVPREELADFFARRDFKAVNVTIPYKELVIPLLDTVSDLARRIGSVNTVVQDAQGRLHGYNTDAYGFTEMVRRAGIPVSGRKCLVLGSGGASKTACACLHQLNAGEVVVISRKGLDNYTNLYRHADAQVIVNATPVGMYPNNGKTLLHLADFPRLEGVLDLIHNPAKTALLLEAERLGIPCANGMYMLAAQAKRASELFFDRMLPDVSIDGMCARITQDTMNVVLIGLPGTGKSTVGRLLAQKMARPFLDTDDMIRERTGLTCADYLRAHGEEAFRVLETEAVAEAGKRCACVIATGGGVVTREKNRDLLRQNGVIFELQRPLNQLEMGDHPLSPTPEALAELAAHRAPCYAAFRDEAVPACEPAAAAEEVLLRFNARFS